MKRLWLPVLVLLGLTACAGNPDTAQESVQVIAMDTVMVFTAYGEHSTHAAFAAESMAYELEECLSRTDEKSDIARLNSAPAGVPVELDGAAAQLLSAALEWEEKTGGAFDPTLAAVSSAWGFTEDSFRVPSPKEISDLLAHTGGEHVRLTEKTASHDEGTEVDLGGIAKGYVADKAAEIFDENQIPRGLVDLGGNIYARGARPDGGGWRVGIRDPKNPGAADAYVGILTLQDSFAVTSGGYERYFEEGGKTYHHILDPSTGYPAESGLLSVTVTARRQEGALTGTMCDALSTALFVMGEEAAVDFWRTSADAFDLILVTEDGRVLVTGGIEENFAAGEENGYTYERIS